MKSEDEDEVALPSFTADMCSPVNPEIFHPNDSDSFAVMGKERQIIYS